VTAQFGDKAGGAVRSPGGFRRIGGGGRVQFSLKVSITESVDGEVSGQHRSEESDSGQGDGIECGDARTSGRCRRLAQIVEFGDRFAG
jgi:hypothetical protein